jgi:carboxymethylenebutenolidase
LRHFQHLDADGITADLEATLEHLAGVGFEHAAVATVGFCMGGMIAFVAACTWELGASVTFYGGGVAQGRFGFPPLIELAPTLQTPWLGLFGDLDGGIPVAVPRAEVVRYPEADHGSTATHVAPTTRHRPRTRGSGPPRSWSATSHSENV